MRYAIQSALIFLVFMGCAQSKSKPITEVSQTEINNVIVVDVRTPEEFASGHIDKAVNINWYDENFVEQFETIKKDNTIYLYCKKGGRSAKAQELLHSLGYEKTVNLEGGYDAWAEKKDEY